MYDRDARHKAPALTEQRLSLRAISNVTGISRATLRDCRDHPEKLTTRRGCPRCAEEPWLPEPRQDYAYLLGLYLGDGCISVGGVRERGVWMLRIMCADAWPGLLAECKRTMVAVRPDNTVPTRQRDGCTEVVSYSRHWPCLFPQHGPGRKHKRKIEFTPWQRSIVDQYPGDFARGLFRSDGSRVTSRVRRPLASGGRWYAYPRYMFTNESRDSVGLCGDVLDLPGAAWRSSRRNTISVARREAVARLDEFVGPTYLPGALTTGSAGTAGTSPAGRRSGRGRPASRAPPW